MRLKYLRYLLRIQSNGSINRASIELGLPQQRLSRLLRYMEAELGCEIFQRSPAGVTATRDGQIILNTARSILEQYDSLSRQLKEKGKSDIRGDLHLQRPPYLWPNNYMEDITRNFLQDYPHAKIRDTEYLGARNLEANGIGFYLNTLGAMGMRVFFPPDFILSPKYRVRMTCYASIESFFAKKYKTLSLKTARRLPLIIYSPMRNHMLPLSSMWQTVGEPQNVLCTNNSLLYHERLRRGEGVIITGRRILLPPYSDYLVEIPLKDKIFMELGLGYALNAAASPLAKAFINYFKAFPAPPASLPV